MNYRPGQVARSTKRRGRSDGDGHCPPWRICEELLAPFQGVLQRLLRMSSSRSFARKENLTIRTCLTPQP